MKKILAMLLAATMVFSLAACGSSSSSDDASSDTDTAAESGDTDTSDTADADVTYETMELNVSCSYNESETTGQQLAYFCDYITEASGGAITFNIYWGATFCSSSEDLEYVGNGSVDMTMLSVSEYTEALPLTNFPTMGYGSQSDAVEYVEYIMFENEETAALIEQEHIDANIKVLGVNAGGTNAIASKEELTNYEGISGKILGVMMNMNMYEELGAEAYFSTPPNTYSDLQKGVVDCAAISLAGMVSLAWYEVAPYIIIDGMYSVSNYYTVNLDKWNSFDEATQALFNEAAEAALEKSYELNDGELENCIETINSYNAEQGIDFEVTYQDEEHAETMYEIYLKNTFADCRTVAANAGISDEMEIILSAVEEYLGVEVASE